MSESEGSAADPAASLPAGPWQAVLFDFDGVLVESADIKIAAFRALYAPHGPDIIDRVIGHHIAHGGVSRRQKIRLYHREFLGLTLTPDELEALCRKFSALVEDAVVAARAVAGAETLVAAAAETMPLFIVSGTPQAELERIVTRRGLGGHFTEVHGSPPEKEPIIRGILDRHGLAAARTLFVGDSMTDHTAAGATGLAFVGRVPAGAPSAFPPGTATIPDLTALALS